MTIFAQKKEIYCRYDDGNIHYGKVVGNSIHELQNAPWEGISETGKISKINEVKILTPTEPKVIIGLGKSYAESWVGKTIPKSVRWFIKPPTAAAANGEDVVLPPTLDEAKIEPELACYCYRQENKKC